MKITISQLRKIIAEEVELAMPRQPHLDYPVNDDLDGHGCPTCSDEGHVPCPTCCSDENEEMMGAEEAEEAYLDDLDGHAMDDGGIEEVTPKGYEKVVKALKRGKSVKNPWAIAWWMKSKGMKPHKKG